MVFLFIAQTFTKNIRYGNENQKYIKNPVFQCIQIQTTESFKIKASSKKLDIPKIK